MNYVQKLYTIKVCHEREESMEIRVLILSD